MGERERSEGRERVRVWGCDVRGGGMGSDWGGVMSVWCAGVVEWGMAQGLVLAL